MKNIIYALNVLVSAYAAVAYAFSFMASSTHWLVGFVLMTIPILLLVQIGLLILSVFTFHLRGMILSGLMLLLALPSIRRTYATNSESETIEPSVKILSYNVKSFSEESIKENKERFSANWLNWLEEENPDIICFQEAVHSSTFPALESFKKRGYKYYVCKENEINKTPKVSQGLMILSRFPIKNAEFEKFHGVNGVLKVDVEVNGKSFALYNVHLNSMMLSLNSVVAARENENELKAGLKDTFRRIGSSFKERGEQGDLLIEMLKKDKKGVVVCGDFNELPYGYCYSKLRRILNNGFEDKGNGFGFTYNELPHFIRIDNQFYDKDFFEIKSFKTIKYPQFSDHNPLIGVYTLK